MFLSPQSTLLPFLTPANDKVIDYLMIDESLPIDMQGKSALCGLIYMKTAMIKVRDHWKSILEIEDKFEGIIPKLKHNIIPCAQHNLAHCDQHPPNNLELPHSHFEVKKWTRNLMDSSDKFLHQLIQLVWTKQRTDRTFNV